MIGLFNLLNEFIDNKISSIARERLIKFSLLISVAYVIIRIIDNVYLAKPPGIGDEWFFFKDFSYYLNNGYYDSVINGTSIPFMIITELFYTFVHNISLALRLSNALMVFLVFFYFFTRKNLLKKKNKTIFFIFLSLLIGTSGGMFYGTNDSFHLTSLIIIYCECYLYIKNKSHNNSILVASFIICILSRPLWVLTVPVILASCLIIEYLMAPPAHKLRDNKIIIIFLFSILISFVFNYPRLFNENLSSKNGDGFHNYMSLSYTDKSNTYKTDDANFNWTQWHYYSQMVANSKKFGLFAPLTSWNEVKNYKVLNGEGSLPKSPQKYVFGYPLQVLKRLPISLVEIFLMSIRYIGIFLFIIPISIFFKYIKNFRDDKRPLLIPVTVFLTILIFALIHPRMIENRWLSPAYIFSLIFALDQDNYFKSILNDNIILLNLLLMDLVTIWALWKWRIFINI